MSAMGRWWGTSRRGSTGEAGAGTGPDTGPETAQLRIGRSRWRRFAWSSWGSARDVEVGPDRRHDAAADPTGGTGGAAPGAVALATDLDPPTPPYGTPFGHDGPGPGAAHRELATPPWRRPAGPASATASTGSGSDMSTPSDPAAPGPGRDATTGAPNDAETAPGDGGSSRDVSGTRRDLPANDDGSPAPHTPPALATDPAPEAVTENLAAAPPAAPPATPPATPPAAPPAAPSAPRPAPAPTPAPATPPAPVARTVDDEPGTTLILGNAGARQAERPTASTTAAADPADGPGAAPTSPPADAPGAGPKAASTPAATIDERPRGARHAASGAEPGPVDRSRVGQGRLGIDEVTPEVAGGRHAAKAVVGEVVPVGATVWREGHDAVAATLVWQRRPGLTHADVASLPEPDDTGSPADAVRTARMVAVGTGTDRVAGSFVPDLEGLWSFRVEAWSDPWSTWRHAVEVKAGAGQGAAELANDLETGARLLERGALGMEDRTGLDDRASDGATVCRGAAGTLRDTGLTLSERLARALSEPVHRVMTAYPVRELVTRGRTHHVFVERDLALAGSWYEFFPRSTGGRDAEGRPVHGTFATAARELERVAAMGFDVAYLPPIHPVGTVNRKGRNNTLDPGPDDVGSPWAIGSAAGGHDAVEPLLGTLDDFDAFVARARELGLEVALDLALQCAPDHPWAAEHPEWFVVRPDGTIAYAENPPKRYQDIYPVNFDTDPDGIYAEVLRVVEHWIAHGVRVFRVDNPHTKPPDFWAWLIAEVHRRDPGVVFLAEAFTRPARMFGLARAGFSQSYTYFTWRTGKQELQEFFELHRDRIDEARPNCFVNTPDILHESLQVGGPGMFALRAALAATLSPTWGVYAGFELFEHQPVRAGSEEYLDSEKYELRPRDFAGALAQGRSLEPWLARLNAIRRAHPALRQLRTLRFHGVDNDALLAFSKTDPRTGDAVIGVITLNPFGVEDGILRLDLGALGMAAHERFDAVDEVSGQVFDWGQSNFVRLEPWRDVAHVVAVRRRH